jgi:hypothetical protein
MASPTERTATPTSPLNDYLVGEGPFDALTPSQQQAVKTCSLFAIGAAYVQTPELLHERLCEASELVDHVMEQPGVGDDATRVLLLLWIVGSVQAFAGAADD